ncbi:MULTISPECIES: site-specific integrase [Cysteiniphilum]|uniref:Integrase n=1 Tax=Cysteiniphilum litorale TaxID=2056700 RepID=A0A8J2Z6G7_9GAMM|nr:MULTISPECIES: site-specific integrase [Cysteiniphilum]GGG05872.1 hypothetical protein GCM10010995_24230 [Cysteiniphilum litorale]
MDELQTIASSKELSNELQKTLQNGIELEKKSRSINTLKRYEKAIKLLRKYCDKHNQQYLPLSPEVAYAFFSYMHMENYKWEGIKVVKSAIDFYHSQANLISPLSHPRICSLLEGIKRDIGVDHKSSEPLLFDAIKMIIDEIPDDGLINLRDKAIFLLGFSGGFRSAELLSLMINDIAFKPQGLILTIRRSKTDQEGRGHTLAIPFNRKDKLYCPVIALKNWVDAINLKQGFLFRSFYKGGCKIRNNALSYIGLYKMFKNRCAKVGIDEKLVSPHGLRSGFNTSAAMVGADLIKMREITNQSLSTQQRYIKKVNLFDNNANDLIFHNM